METHRAVPVELHHAVGGGVGHAVGEHVATGDVGVGPQRGAQAGAVEDVVAQDQGDAVLADEVGADEERLRQAVGAGLHGVADRHPPRAAVAEQLDELALVLGGGDDQDLADPGHHQRREGVVDHRLVVDGHQLLADAPGDRVEPGARATGQDDPLHGPRLATAGARRGRSASLRACPAPPRETPPHAVPPPWSAAGDPLAGHRLGRDAGPGPRRRPGRRPGTR